MWSYNASARTGGCWCHKKGRPRLCEIRPPASLPRIYAVDSERPPRLTNYPTAPCLQPGRRPHAYFRGELNPTSCPFIAIPTRLRPRVTYKPISGNGDAQRLQIAHWSWTLRDTDLQVHKRIIVSAFTQPTSVSAALFSPCYEISQAHLISVPPFFYFFSVNFSFFPQIRSAFHVKKIYQIIQPTHSIYLFSYSVPKEPRFHDHIS